MDILTGGFATSFAVIFTNPMEVVKTRLQLQGELAIKGGRTRNYSLSSNNQSNLVCSN